MSLIDRITALAERIASEIKAVRGIQAVDGKVGINVEPPNVVASLHVRSGAGSGASVNAAADNLYVDVEGTGGITVGNSEGDSGTLYFANPSNSRAGGLLYVHSSGVLAVYAGAVQRAQFTNNGLRLLTLPTSASGLPAGTVWNDNGTLKVVT